MKKIRVPCREGRSAFLKLERRKERVREILSEMLKDRFLEKVMGSLVSNGELDRTAEAIVKGELDPYTACDYLISDTLGKNNS